MDLWECTYSDQLKYCIEQVSSPEQKKYFMEVFKRMGKYVTEHDSATGITFREYFDLFER